MRATTWTTGPTRTAMAEPSEPAGWRPVVSARVRIIGWTVGVLALALALLMFVTWQVLSARSDALADDELSHEAYKFRSFAGSAEEGRYTRPEDLLHDWLRNNLPDTSEALFTVTGGAADRRSPGDPPARLDNDPIFVARVAAATEPSYGWADSTAGRVRYAVLPVRVGDQQAALVVVEFRDVMARPLNNAGKAIAIVVAAALVMSAAACWLVAGRVLAPIRLVRSTAENIGESDLRDRIDVVGNDDVAQLARTFNHMLDRLEAAFIAQREFLDDAGHELRTPITVIRGHLELMGDDPLDRADATALVLDELQRMNRIVDDLLVLAQSERPDFLNLGEVNLTDLVVDVVAKARPLADRQWRVGEAADTVIVADGQRLTQALMQLVANAVRHTGAGDRIAVGSRVEAGRTVLWVSDDGPGVAPADRERIFERFARGADHRRTEGAGLGLAIVRSIARAHDGEARLAENGPGATFVLELPAPDAMEEAQ
jgi:two-component system, OmpR family, sensor kinase